MKFFEKKGDNNIDEKFVCDKNGGEQKFKTLISELNFQFCIEQKLRNFVRLNI